MISKELLSEVLGIPIQKVMDSSQSIMPEDNEYRYLTYGRNNAHNVNIYELAHKCKEWALKQGYILQSNLNSQAAYCIINDTGEVCNFQANTEPKAIFKACELVYTLKKL